MFLNCIAGHAKCSIYCIPRANRKWPRAVVWTPMVYFLWHLIDWDRLLAKWKTHKPLCRFAHKLSLFLSTGCAMNRHKQDRYLRWRLSSSPTPNSSKLTFIDFALSTGHSRDRTSPICWKPTCIQKCLDKMENFNSEETKGSQYFVYKVHPCFNTRKRNHTETHKWTVNKWKRSSHLTGKSNSICLQSLNDFGGLRLILSSSTKILHVLHFPCWTISWFTTILMMKISPFSKRLGKKKICLALFGTYLQTSMQSLFWLMYFVPFGISSTKILRWLCYAFNTHVSFKPGCFSTLK